MLSAQGVKNVKALLGGWNDWIAGGGATVKGATPKP
jgi:3-mercaptopyruvate sulfurtransferase SseA